MIGGDAQYWDFSGWEGGNMCYLAPLRKKSKDWPGVTNLHLITRSGNVYDFDIVEVNEGLFNENFSVAPDDPPKQIMPACDPALVQQLRMEKELATSQQASFRVQLDGLRNEMQAKVDPVRFVSELDDDYSISRKLRRDPFDVQRIYSRGDYTYIKADPQRHAAFFEGTNKHPRMVNYEDDGGVLVIPGIVDRGCLAIDKTKACFRRKK